MSPRKLLDVGNEDAKQQSKGRVVIHGPRPTPLKIKQESHTLHKHHHHKRQIRKPIIIYTHSPKVIHTKPQEFMALVQKLTGLSRTKDQEADQQQETLKQDHHDRSDHDYPDDYGVTDEKDKIMKAKSPLFKAPSNPYMADVPLFTPNSGDYFWSVRPLF